MVCLNDIEITWVNLDEIFRSISSRAVSSIYVPWSFVKLIIKHQAVEIQCEK